MTDLKRVYHDLQEENESYEILLGEKTLSGEVTGTDFFRKSFSWGEGGNVGSPNGGVQGGWSGFGFQGGLEAVGEGEEDGLESEEEEYSDSSDEEDGEEDIEKILLESKGTGSVNSGAVSAQSPTRKRRSSRRSKSIAPAHAKRDSMAGVGIGGGLDLAAELEMAQKEDELDEVEIEKKREKEEKRLRKKEERERKKREARAARRDGSQSMPVGIEGEHDSSTQSSLRKTDIESRKHQHRFAPRNQATPRSEQSIDTLRLKDRRSSLFSRRVRKSSRSRLSKQRQHTQSRQFLFFSSST